MEILNQDMKTLYNSVNYEDEWRKKEKNLRKTNVLLFHHFTLEIFNRGVFLPITKKYSITVLNLVNDTQDFMCIKYKAFLPCKQHPSGVCLCVLTKVLTPVLKH